MRSPSRTTLRAGATAFLFLAYVVAAASAWLCGSVGGKPSSATGVGRQARAAAGLPPSCAGLLGRYAGAAFQAAATARWPLDLRYRRREERLLGAYAGLGCPATAMMVARVSALAAAR